MKYEGDKKFTELLRKLSCPMTLREIKAYLRGALAAPHVVTPSRLYSEIFRGREPEFDTMEQSQRFLSNLLALWNQVQEPRSLRAQGRETHSRTASGLRQRIADRDSEITAFIRGLDLGGADPAEMSPDGRDALESLSKAAAFLKKYKELCSEEGVTLEKVDETRDLLDKLDGVIDDCMLRIIEGLKESRMAAAQRLGSQEPEKLRKISRNAPCPCGSGKKYKKCCYLKLH